MIRGLSHSRGIIFMSPSFISHVWVKNKELHQHTIHNSKRMLLREGGRAFFLLPVWYQALILGFALLSVSSYFISFIPIFSFHYYVIFLYSFHFWFPKEMRKYHAAEHQVFSTRQPISRAVINEIKTNSVLNQNCSTNVVVLYFLSLVLLFTAGSMIIPPAGALMWSSYFSIIISFTALSRWFRADNLMSRIVKKTSYLFQKKVTTFPPEEKHLEIAVTAYVNLKQAEKNHKKSGE